ncbi:MAG: ion channel [Actinobacteria bacterium]|nr:ion channel [Actinomycetota bacterium]MCL5447329.1 ion channel [Actinomycetota bacterium]
MPFIQILIGKVRRHQALTLLLLAAFFTILGAILFSATQHVSLGTGLYWAITTATTVGYGDVTPHNAAGRIIAVGVMLTAIPLFGAIFALLAALATAARLRRMIGLDFRLPPKGYVVIYGNGRIIDRVVDELHSSGTPCVVVADISDDDLGPLEGRVHLVKGSPTSEGIVRKSHPEDASQVLITGDSDADVLVTAVLVRHIAPSTPIIAVTDSAKIARALDDLGVKLTVSGDELMGHTLAKSLEAPHAAEVLLRLVDSNGYKLQEVPVNQSDIGKQLSAVRSEHNDLVLGLVTMSHGVALGVGTDPVVSDGDHLIVVGIR